MAISSGSGLGGGGFTYAAGAEEMDDRLFVVVV